MNAIQHEAGKPDTAQTAVKPKKANTRIGTEQVGNVKVPIYKLKRKGGHYYQIADHTQGRRRLRSFGTHAKAKKEANKIAGQISSGNVTAAQMLNREAASYGRAVELLRPTGASLELACSTYAKAFEILGGDFIIQAAQFYKRHRTDQLTTNKTVLDVVTELIEAKTARGKSPRYISDLSSRLSRFANDFAVDINTVTTADVQRWLDRLSVAAQTAKNFRTVLFTLFGFAEARGYIFKGSNPAADTEKIEANGGAIEIFTPDEIVKLLKAAPKSFVPFLALGAFAGLRSAEIERLDWHNVDLAGGFIHVAGEKTKTRSRRLVPILPNLAAWLKRYRRSKGKVWRGSPDDLRDVRTATVDKAKTEWKDNGLRHSFISYRLADIQNAAQVALEAGNSPAMVFKHYRELVKPDQAKAWFAVGPK